MKKPLKELDRIKITGTVVDVYNDGKSLQVEVTDKNGEILALFTLETEGLEYEIMNMKKNKDEVQETIERIKNKIERLSDYINLHGYPQEKGIQEKLKWIKEDMYLRFQKDAIEIVESEETEGLENEITTSKYI